MCSRGFTTKGGDHKKVGILGNLGTLTLAITKHECPDILIGAIRNTELD